MAYLPKPTRVPYHPFMLGRPAVAEGSYNDQVEDWHNIVAQYYGNVQVRHKCW